MRFLHTFVCASVALLAGANLAPRFCLAQAEPPDGPRLRVARLINRLGADDFAERTSADAELAELGPVARQQLEQAAESDDTEVRLRARALLWKLKVADLWLGTPISMAENGAPASEWFAVLARQSGNPLLVGEGFGKFSDAPVTLAKTQGPFWRVLDEVCRASGNATRPHYDTRHPGLVITTGKMGEFPVAYAGPVRAVVVSATRRFSEELDYRELDRDQDHTFQLQLKLTWEGQFRLVAYREQPELIEAVTDTGVTLAAGQPSSVGWNSVGRGTQQVACSLQLEPPPVSATRLDRLSLQWPMIAVGGAAVMEVSDLNDGRTHFQHDAQLQVVRVEERNGRQVHLTLLVTRDLVVPEPRDILFHENGFELFDTEGRPYRKQGQTNTYSDGGAQIKINFLGQEGSQPDTLRFTYPRIRSRRDLRITFRDVALPNGRPR